MVDVESLKEELAAIGLDFLDIPSEYAILIKIFIFTLLAVFYSIFIWKFYRFVGKKDLIKLHLNKYNRTDHPTTYKLVAGFFYFIEYIIILPFLIFFWFAVFVIFLIVLSQADDVGNILLVAGVIIAAIRMTSYYKEELSKDLAKALPFTIFVVFLTSTGFFSYEKVLTRIAELPSLLSHIYYYLIFIIGLEIILRVLDLFFSIIGLNPEEEEKQVSGEKSEE